MMSAMLQSRLSCLSRTLRGQLQHYCFQRTFSQNTSRTTKCLSPHAGFCKEKQAINEKRTLGFMGRASVQHRTTSAWSHSQASRLQRSQLHTSLPRDSHSSKLLRLLVRDRVYQQSVGVVARKMLLIDSSVRWMSSTGGMQQKPWQKRNLTVMLYVIAGSILVVGFSYAAVPLYTVFCQATGLGGQATAGHDIEKVETMAPVRGRELVIRFNADTAASMRWNFRPQQSEVRVVPGETALAFYSAMNPTDKPIVGISTYNVVPFDAGQYFNKIQCFCFEEQRLNPHEQVDMPVFFYIDPDFDDDPKMEKVNNITLSYTFFESKEGLELPDPWAR